MRNKKVVVDIHGALVTLKEKHHVTKKRHSVLSDMSEKGRNVVSEPLLRLWKEEAPVVVEVVYFALKNTANPEVNFDYLIERLSQRGKPDKALGFIQDFCNETGLSFNDVVKEVDCE